MIRVSENITLADEELAESFIRSSGPGGQHVNKASTGVQLRFDIGASRSLPGGVRARLLGMADARVTSEGVLVITATRHRSQRANREDALGRLVALIREAEIVPKSRRKTRPTRASKTRRLDGKRRRGDLKQSRGRVRPTDD